MKRKSLSKKIRFEVFKRDSFICQYCGAKAPDVVLNVDHIKPVSKGGDNDILNLITSCFSCNSGKSNIELNDRSILDKQRKQLEDLQERKEQINAMFEWQRELSNFDTEVIDEVVSYINEKMGNRSISDGGSFYRSLKKTIKKFKMDNILKAIDTAFEQYARFDDGDITEESADLFLSKIGGVCYMLENPMDEDSRKYYYIRGIASNRFNYCDKRKALELIKAAHLNGYSLDDMQDVTLNARNWSSWRDEMQEYAEDV